MTYLLFSDTDNLIFDKGEKYEMEMGMTLQQEALGNFLIYLQETNRIPCTKFKSKCFKDLSIRPKTIKYTQENIGKTFCGIEAKVT